METELLDEGCKPWGLIWSALRKQNQLQYTGRIVLLVQKEAGVLAQMRLLILSPAWLDVTLNCYLHIWGLSSRDSSATLVNSSNSCFSHQSLLPISLTNSISIPTAGVFLLSENKGVSSRQQVRLIFPVCRWEWCAFRLCPGVELQSVHPPLTCEQGSTLCCFHLVKCWGRVGSKEKLRVLP